MALITNFDFTITKGETCSTFSIPNIVDIDDTFIIPDSQTADITSITSIEYAIYSCNSEQPDYTLVSASGLPDLYDDDISGLTFTDYSDGVYFVKLRVIYSDGTTTHTVETQKCVLIDCTISCDLIDHITTNNEASAELVILLKLMEYAEECGKCEALCQFYNAFLNLMDDDCNC